MKIFNKRIILALIALTTSIFLLIYFKNTNKFESRNKQISHPASNKKELPKALKIDSHLADERIPEIKINNVVNPSHSNSVSPEHFELLDDHQFLDYLEKQSLTPSEVVTYKKHLIPLSRKNQEYVKNFVGKYRGKLATNGGYFSIEPKVFDAEAEIEIEKINENKIMGVVEILLFNEKGKIFSRSQFRGEIESFYSKENSENANIFSEDGDSNPSYYHFFLSSTLEQLIGIYYAPGEDPSSDVRRLGTLRLNKTN